MKNTMKKLLSLLLVSVMLLGGTIIPSQAAIAATGIPSDIWIGYELNTTSHTMSGINVYLYSGDMRLMDQYVTVSALWIGTRIDIVYNGTGWLVGDSYQFEVELIISSSYGRKTVQTGTITINPAEATTISYEIPLSVYEGITAPSGPIFPDGYDFDRDSYSFSNLNEPISWRYYVSAFGTIRGYQLYNTYETGGNHGHCFGMAQSTASILENAPVVSSFANKSTLDSLVPSDYSNELESTLRSYIKYSHIYQFTDSVASMRESNKGYDAVYNAVENYVKYGGVPILIDMWASFGGHTVFAVGIDGDDIIVNDSNEAEPVKRTTKIVKTENGWTYSGGGWNWNSDNGDTINYVTATTALYYMILDDLDDFISNHKLLVKGSQNLSYSSTSAMTEIRQSVMNENSEINNQRLYWLDDEINTITIANNTMNDETVCVSGYDLAIETILPNDASALVQIGDDVENGISIYSTDGENVDFTFTTEQFDSELLFMSIAGTASGDEIIATQTETGLIVTGISDGTVTLSKDDEVIATQTINDAISDIEITYDKTGADESIEVDYEQPEEPTDPEVPTEPEMPTEPDVPAEPDEPTDDTTDCSCMCHSKNSFMQFFYKIFRLFWQLFGMNMDCACGAKHFDAYFFG